jgi:hypothetical protein
MPRIIPNPPPQGKREKISSFFAAACNIRVRFAEM